MRRPGGSDFIRRGHDFDDAAVRLRIEPVDHARVVPRPTFHEQRLLGEAGLGVDDDDTRACVAFALQHVRKHRRALVRTRRAAIGVGRSNHDDDRSVVQCVELSHQQLCLGARLPCMRHGRGGCFGIARHGVPAHIDARGDDQAVVCDALTAAERHSPASAVDGRSSLVNHPHPGAPQPTVPMRDRCEAAQAADVVIGKEAGREAPLRLDQRHVDRAAGIDRYVAGRRRAARTAADHHYVRPGLAICAQAGQSADRRACHCVECSSRDSRRGHGRDLLVSESELAVRFRNSALAQRRLR
jgi:hypothetical protein